MKILIDNGHAKSTAGKRSPDRSFYEWRFNREIAIPLVERLKELGYDAERIVTEDDYDVTLTERCNRVNKWCKKLGTKNVIFISIHANAAPSKNHGWENARGFAVYCAKTASEASHKLAQLLYAEAMKRGFKGNRSTPSKHYWEANFTVIAKTLCPAVLTENLFYNNREDLAILKSEEGKKKIVEMHVDAIVEYLKTKNVR